MSRDHGGPWWQQGVIYQIYPRSFQDTDGDGVGDLPGIQRRLDYVHSLGVEAIWLSPIYPSPMADFGYDVADYTDVDPIFGTLEDFDRLLAACHQRGLKLILDLVPNHTSDQHPWFLESRSSRDNPKRDWYIWRDPAPGSSPDRPLPPNNWRSFFGGPAWTYDEATGQFYLHQFLKEQPELNYRNPEVLAAMLDVMRFWLARGVDGFRVDVLWLLMKDPEFRDEPPNPDWDGVDPHQGLLHIHTQNRPEVHPIIRRMRAVMDAFTRNTGRERVMIGEIYLPIPDLVNYYGENGDECHLPFNFHLLDTPWQAQAVRRLVDTYEAALPAGAWPNWVLGNHDRSRVASRLGQAQARVAQMLLLTLRGTPTCYYGDELGMEDVPIPLAQMQDPRALNQPEIAHLVGRDPARTPMQWDDSPHAGFCAPDVEPWLPLAADFPSRNVEVQSQNPTSMLRLFQALACLRRTEPALHRGRYRAVEAVPHPASVFAYLREHGTGRFLMVLNFGQAEHLLDFRHLGAQGTIRVSTDMRTQGPVSLAELPLAPNQGLVIQL